ncbi:conserved oligomeric golgi complex subunit 2 [Pyrenophora seminiperda CCB06]|uniref:Conserved oligomeric golgi complex subunit 2 n=1 Tax=Pyrenophora seminiperda CCB06 TaxID=1302712 RepID=A0A3M7M158_9PLEO|nr:conserved oligomeric golgi complex subunit 2 [Pyrenophora seminiperda CCB06]
MEQEARSTLRAWEERREKEDLAEKRRVAPGWLDSGVRVIRPVEVEREVVGGEGRKKEGAGQQESLMDLDPQAERKAQEGEELDRVFGGLKV